jgi:hypothetical protein
MGLAMRNTGNSLLESDSALHSVTYVRCILSASLDCTL